MEDSGKEKLQGQKSAAVDAQNSAKQSASVEFDSAKIDKKQKEEQFKNIEGAEERAKAAEKAKQDAAKAVEKQQEKAEKARKKAEITPLQKKAKTKKIAIAVAVAVLILVPLAILAIRKVSLDNMSNENAKKVAEEEYLEIRASANDRSYSKISAGRDKYLELIDNSEGALRFYRIVYFIAYSNNYQTGFDDAMKWVEELESSAVDDEQRSVAQSSRCTCYDIYKDPRYLTECDYGDEEELDEEY